VRAAAATAPVRAAIALALGAALALTSAGCGAEATPAAEAKAPAELIAPGPHPAAVLEMEGLGQVRIELLPELAPETVAHFQRLAAEGFYDGTTFHRVIPGYVIQGGCPLTRDHDPRNDGKGGPGYTIFDEFSDYPARRGMVAMARKGLPDSAGSQFFILHGDAPALDGSYTIFGRVADGMDVVDAIAALEIDTYGRYGPRDRPYPRDARITRVTIEPTGA
jgi:peptidyl-prolyl cis-trans isomerase B (cyclophilin B)